MSSAAAPRLVEPEKLLQTTKRLLATLVSRSEPDFRLAVLNRLCSGPTSQPYPVFLKLLLTIAGSDDSSAKAVVADTIGHGLASMNLPCGVLNSWGSSARQMSTSSARLLGPIEYLTAWSCQPTERLALREATYCSALGLLIHLCNYSDSARRAYPLHLQAEITTRPTGTYSTFCSSRLATIARDWQAGLEADAVAAHAIGKATIDLPQTLPPEWIVRQL